MRSLCLLVLVVVACVPARAAGRAWDDYRATMWIDNLPEDAAKAKLYFQRLREMGCNAGMCYPGRDPQPYADNDFPFYVENLTLGLYIKGDRGWDQAHGGYSQTRDKKHFLRHPCLNDPDYRRQQRERVRELVERYRPFEPWAYCIRDEPSVTTSANPFDFDLGPICMAKFREWLKGQYESLEALNEQWETDFGDWDEVVPLTTDEMKARERQGSENYSSWCDHRTFMDITFAEAVDEFRRYVHEFDPDGIAGLEGLQMPHAFGGYDLWRLSQVQDWMEPYDIGNSREIFRSFAPDKPIVSTTFRADARKLSRKLWNLLLHGDRGTIVWHGRDTIDTGQPDLPLTQYAQDLSGPFKELTGGIGMLLINAERQTDPIAIHYSQPSIQVDWMLETRVDGATWIRRFSSWEASHNEKAMVRNSVCKAIEDLGLQYEFIASPQIEQGELQAKGYRLLFLLRSLALSEKEAEAIRQFVQEGGIVVADGMCGLFDEHGRRLEGGRLDDLFGIRQGKIILGSQPLAGDGPPLPVLKNEVEVAGRFGARPYLIEREVGKGRAIFLNLDLSHYEKMRLHPPQGKPVRELFAGWTENAGLEGPYLLQGEEADRPAVGIEVHRFKSGDITYVALMRNPQQNGRAERLKPDEENVSLEWPLPLSFSFQQNPQQKLFIYDVRNGRKSSHPGGRFTSMSLTLEPWSPVILALAPYEVTAVNLDAPPSVERGGAADLRLSLQTRRRAGTHVLRLSVRHPDGSEDAVKSTNLLAQGGRAVCSVSFAPDDPTGRWQFSVRDVMSGKLANATIGVK
ncbi:MAG: beta-galactosidase [Armatimonadota bacterium]